MMLHVTRVVETQTRSKLLAVIFLWAQFIFVTGSLAGDGTPPNIVLILADDLGWNDLGYQGSEIQTPRIDALAGAGLQLDRYYVQPTCSPTRASLLTGNSSMRLGFEGPLSKLNPTGLPLDQRVLPQYLKAEGYQTALVGKWHLGFRQRAYLPTSRGFDQFYGHLTGGIGYWDHVHGGALDWQRNEEVLREEGYSTHLMAAEAVSVIENRNVDQPLFLYASFNAPHTPNEAPPEAIAAYNTIADPKRRTHAAMVSELDSALGRIFDSLEEQGMLDNTLVWFMSDNGGSNSSSFPPGVVDVFSTLDDWFDGGPLPLVSMELIRVVVLDGASDNSPLREAKGSVYEGGVRVPSFVYWRGQLEPRKVDEMVTVQDVLPTLLSVVQSTEQRVEVDGVNRWPLLKDKEPGVANDFVAKSLTAEALFRFPWKLVQRGSDSVELYNLETDPTEKINLAEKFPERTDEMVAALKAKPRGASVHVSLWETLLDPDFFGGEEVDPPYMEQVKNNEL